MGLVPFLSILLLHLCYNLHQLLQQISAAMKYLCHLNSIFPSTLLHYSGNKQLLQNRLWAVAFKYWCRGYLRFSSLCAQHPLAFLDMVDLVASQGIVPLSLLYHSPRQNEALHRSGVIRDTASWHPSYFLDITSGKQISSLYSSDMETARTSKSSGNKVSKKPRKSVAYVAIHLPMKPR